MSDFPTKKPDPRRSFINSRNKAAGEMFEKRLSLTFEYYQRHGFASIEKTPEPMRVIKNLKDGNFLAVFTQKAQSDYEGTIKGGRAVYIEAKFTSTEKMEYGRVKKHQAEYLERHQNLGALCYIVAGFKTGTVYKIPWTNWRDMKSYFGKTYVTEEDLKNFKVNVAYNGTLLLF